MMRGQGAARQPSLASCPTLVLNADYQPLSYFPLSLWNWQETVKALVLDRVTVIAFYDRKVRSPGMEIHLPSVVALKQYMPQNRRPPFTRFNLFLRDRFCCQYCNQPFSANELTFDHLIPRSRGGKTSWTNIVTACTRCNLRKGNKLFHECGMQLATRPFEPTAWQLQQNGRAFTPNYLHDSWRDWLYWDTELETD